MKTKLLPVLPALLLLASCAPAISDTSSPPSAPEQLPEIPEVPEETQPPGDTIGGPPDYDFQYYYLAVFDYLYLLTDIVGEEKSFNFFDNVVEKNKWNEKGKLDFSRLWLREGIEYFGITKEEFVNANKANRDLYLEQGIGELIYSDAVIDALFLEDEEARILALKNPNVLYRDGVFVSIYDLFALSEEAAAPGETGESALFASEIGKTGFSARELLDFSKETYQKMIDLYEPADSLWIVEARQPQFDALWQDLEAAVAAAEVSEASEGASGGQVKNSENP
jgi:hypothetical protein